MNRQTLLIRVVWLGLISAGTGASTQADPLPVSLYASLPSVSQPALSPDGTKLVMLRTVGDTQHAFLLDLATGKSNPVLGADPEQFLINRCGWANNKRLICSIRMYGKLRPGMFGTYYKERRTTFTRMIAVDHDGSNRLELIEEPTNPLGSDLKWNDIRQDNIISMLVDEPDSVLISLRRDDRLRPSVYRLNIYDNKLERVRKYHDSVYYWLADRHGELKFAAGFRHSNPVAFTVNRNRLIPVDISHFEGISTPQFAGISPAGNRAYVASYYGGERYSLHEIDIKTAEVVGTLFDDGEYDLFGGSLYQDPNTGEPLLIQYWKEEFVTHWFDKERQAGFAELKLALGELHDNVRLVSASDDLTKVILLAEGKGTTPTYYFYDSTAKSLRRLATTYSELPEVVDFRVIRYPAKDGYEITAYVATPPGEGPFPTIVHPHGGPNARDYPGFDYWTQFFVSRGYAVIKPNFRGSVGYGASHLAGGFEQWGMRMQDDVMDGLDWMIEQGIADPKRVCVVGASYGGYVALVAAYKAPDRLRCAVSFAGVTDLAELKKWVMYFDLGELTLDRIQSGTSVNENSPIRQVDRIGVPLLIVHGDVDRSVMIEQSREFVAALKKAGKPHTYIEQKNGDHHLSIQSHRIELFEAMDEFLGKHL